MSAQKHYQIETLMGTPLHMAGSVLPPYSRSDSVALLFLSNKLEDSEQKRSESGQGHRTQYLSDHWIKSKRG